MSVRTTVKSIQDIMRQDVGVDGDGQLAFANDDLFRTLKELPGAGRDASGTWAPLLRAQSRIHARILPHLEGPAACKFADAIFEFEKRWAISGGSGHSAEVGRRHVTKPKLERLSLTLLPLVQQHRIVAKLDELMALCDELECQLTTTASTRRQLLEATLHEALLSRASLGFGT